MKGIIFNLLEQVVTDDFGSEAWDGILAGAGSEGVYTAVGSYPDEELMRLVGGAAAAVGMEVDAAVRWFGRKALPLLRERYPIFFEGHADTKSFVLTLNDIIHPEVRKLFPGADVPVFDFETSVDGVLSLGYKSKRKLCSLAEGLLEGAADQFGEVVAIEQPQCMKRGDDKCVLVCSFAVAPGI